MYKKIQETLAIVLWLGCIFYLIGQAESYCQGLITSWQAHCRAGAGIIILALDTWHISRHFDDAEWT